MKNKLLIALYVMGCVLFGVCLSFAIYHVVSDGKPAQVPETTAVGETLMLSEDRAAPTETTQPVTQPEETETEASVPSVETTAPSREEKTDPQSGQVYTVVYCTGDSVNVRKGPGTDHESVGKIHFGESADRIQDLDGWSRVIFHNEEVYISSRYLSETEPQETTAPAETEKKEASGDNSKEETKPEKQPEMKFRSVKETVYCTGSNVNIRKGPGTDYEKVGRLQVGDALHRTGIGDKWSRVEYKGSTVFVSSTYLSTEKPSKPSIYSPAYTYQYQTPEGIMPFAMFVPADYEGTEPLPLIVSLHGQSETGKSQSFFENKFLVRDFRHWEHTGLQTIDAIIVCPHLSGYGYSDSWNNPEAAVKFFTMMDYVLNNYKVDRTRIILQGQSMGAQGALYLAADTRSCFTKLVLVSGYEPYRDYSGVHIPIRGYSGSPDIPRPREDRTSYNFMAACFSRQFGLDNWFVRACSHDQIPLVAFHEDLDGNGVSDLAEWMLAP